MANTPKNLTELAKEIAEEVTLPQICEIILALSQRVETLEKLNEMGKKNKEPKVREPKTADYICNDALYYQSDLICKHGDQMKVTNFFNGNVDIVIPKHINGVPAEVTYHVNEVTWRMWVKEIRVVKLTQE